MYNDSQNIHNKVPNHSTLYMMVYNWCFQTCAISLQLTMQTKEREPYACNCSLSFFRILSEWLDTKIAGM
jgi:hypothetical protein